MCGEGVRASGVLEVNRIAQEAEGVGEFCLSFPRGVWDWEIVVCSVAA